MRLPVVDVRGEDRTQHRVVANPDIKIADETFNHHLVDPSFSPDLRRYGSPTGLRRLRLIAHEALRQAASWDAAATSSILLSCDASIAARSAKRCTFRVRKASASDLINITGSRIKPRKPKPPAFVTAATISDLATPPIPTNTIG
jgi:hypothetical protein